MLINCTNKGCYAQDEHLLDESHNKENGGNVICMECGEAINVPRTTKTVLKYLGQIRREAKSPISFVCKACNKKDKPVLKKLPNGKTIATCSGCGATLDVHPSFIETLKVIKNGENPI